MRFTIPTALHVVFLSVCALHACGAEPRTWTDITGKHTLQGTFESSADGVVTIRIANGRLVKVPHEKLGEADRAFIELQKIVLPETDANKPEGLEKVAAPTTFEELEHVVESQRHAKQVLELFEAFLTNKATAAGDRKKAQDSVGRWKELALEGAIRYGGVWRKPNEIKQLREEARAMIDQASRLITIGNDALARETLLRASKIDPEDVQADFTLGLLHALVGAHPEDARKHFLICCRRLEAIGEFRDARQDSNLIAAMNNAAIAEVRASSPSAALKRWTAAADAGLTPPELIQNLGRFSDLAADGEFVSVSSSTVKTIGLLYAKAATANQSQPYDRATGWLYIPHLAAATEEADEADETSGDAADDRGRQVTKIGTDRLRVFATGTGFMVGPELVVTNRHVAEDAVSFGIRCDGRDLAALSGDVIAISETADLALLRFPGLSGKPLAVATQPPRLSAAVRVLGFPMSDILGNSLKVTSGTVAGLPSKNGPDKLNDMILLDAVANPGNSGGPVIDISGGIVGVLTLGVMRHNSTRRPSRAQC